MVSSTRALLLSCLSLALLSCGSTDNSEPPAALSEIEQPLDLRVRWSTDTGAGASSASLDMRPLLINDQILSIDIEGEINSINAESGRINWSAETGIKAITGLAGNSHVVIATSADGDLAAYNLLEAGLEKRWSIQLNGEIRATPALNQDQLFVRTVSGKLSAVSLADGNVEWTVSRRIPALTLTGNSSPVISNELVIVGFDDGKITAFESKNGQTVWETAVSHPVGRTEIERLVDIDGHFILKDGVIYVSSYQGRLAAIQAVNGNVLWSREFSSYQSMVADDQAIYLSGDMSHIWSIDRRSGSAFWKQEVLHSRKITAPQLVNGNLVVADFEGYVHWFDKTDGSLKGRIQPSNARHISQPLLWQNNILVFDSAGQLSSLSLR
ncbi:MAG: outer membrane protein assembly factor BamB [Gammaproteobacteria bacterium]|nr:outer membrane protein assembly factor BamB [Gammaproteobacteria bacterium]